MRTHTHMLVCCVLSALASIAIAENYDETLEEHWLRMLGGPTLELKGAFARDKALHPTQDAYGAVNGVRHEVDAVHTSNEGTDRCAVSL